MDGLPAHSRYVAALLDDEAEAERIAALDDPDDHQRVGLAGYDPHRALLAALIDAVNMNTVATIAAAGAEPPKFEPLPRPETGLDRARARLRAQARQALADLAMGRPPTRQRT